MSFVFEEDGGCSLGVDGLDHLGVVVLQLLQVGDGVFDALPDFFDHDVE